MRVMKRRSRSPEKSTTPRRGASYRYSLGLTPGVDSASEECDTVSVYKKDAQVKNNHAKKRTQKAGNTQRVPGYMSQTMASLHKRLSFIHKNRRSNKKNRAQSTDSEQVQDPGSEVSDGNEDELKHTKIETVVEEDGPETEECSVSSEPSEMLNDPLNTSPLNESNTDTRISQSTGEDNTGADSLSRQAPRDLSPISRRYKHSSSDEQGNVYQSTLTREDSAEVGRGPLANNNLGTEQKEQFHGNFLQGEPMDLNKSEAKEDDSIISSALLCAYTTDSHSSGSEEDVGAHSSSIDQPDLSRDDTARSSFSELGNLMPVVIRGHVLTNSDIRKINDGDREEAKERTNENGHGFVSGLVLAGVVGALAVVVCAVLSRR